MELSDILAAEKRGYVLPAESWNFPEIDLSNFPEERRAGMDALYGVLKKDLSAPYVVVYAANHGERRDWSDHVLRDYGIEAYKQFDYNSLRMNNISQIVEILSGVSHIYIGKSKDVLGLLVKEVTTDPGIRIYDSMSIDERITFVRCQKQKAYAVMEFLAKPSV